MYRTPLSHLPEKHPSMHTCTLPERLFHHIRWDLKSKKNTENKSKERIEGGKQKMPTEVE
jgi:hypothetical protein